MIAPILGNATNEPSNLKEVGIATSTNASKWTNAVSNFLQYVLKVKYQNLPSLVSALYEYHCYVQRALTIQSAGYGLIAEMKNSKVFKVHYHPGNMATTSYIQAVKGNVRQQYRLYLNIGIESKKSGVEHAPDISMFLWMQSGKYPYGAESKLVAICECKMKKLKLGDVREFLGYRIELNPDDKAHVLERHIRSCLFSTYPVPGNLLDIGEKNKFDVEQMI